MVNWKGMFLKGPTDIAAALTSLRHNYEYAKRYRDAKCLYVMGQEAWFLPAQLSPDLQKLYPKNINRQFEIQAQYTLRPEGVPFYILYDRSHRSIKLGDKPSKIKVKKPGKFVIESKDKKGNTVIVEQVKMQEYEIQGGRELSADGYKWAKSNVMRWLEPTITNQRLIAVAVISFLVGIIIHAGFIGQVV